jgi:hypothetical protein
MRCSARGWRRRGVAIVVQVLQNWFDWIYHIVSPGTFRPHAPPLSAQVTGLAQKLGQLEAVHRDSQPKYWADLKLVEPAL